MKMNWSEHTKIQRKEMQKQIEELQEKLKELEEKSPAEEAYKDWWGEYPGTEIWTKDDEMRWVSFSAGYEFAYAISTAKEVMEKVQEEQEEDEWKSVALRFGEKLSAIGPCGYYDFTPVEWYEWVVDIYENTANEYLKLLEKERARAKAQKHEKEQKWDVVRESVKWCKEHQNESVEDYLSAPYK